MVSDNNFHMAVMNGGGIYDAYTGAAGMIWSQYQAAMWAMGTLHYTVLP